MARLCKAGIRLREQIDDAFPDRDRTSDGWIGDTRHSTRDSDHNPDPATGLVRAIDVDCDFRSHPSTPFDFADQVRSFAKSDGRIKYIIFTGRIASGKSLWRWVKYRGINPHNHHIHISFTEKGDNDGTYFKIPILGG